MFDFIDSSDEPSLDLSNFNLSQKSIAKNEDYYAATNGKIKSGINSPQLEAQVWYHGRITRIEAESRVLYNGQFLVRDCLSKPENDNFVLTCNWDGRPVHFMINRVPLLSNKSLANSSSLKYLARSSQPDCPNKNDAHNNNIEAIYDALTNLLLNGPKTSPTVITTNKPSLNDSTVSLTSNFGYQFEADIFADVVSLINFYMSQKKPITRDSMCIIRDAVHRPENHSKFTTQEKSFLDSEPALYMQCGNSMDKKSNFDPKTDSIDLYKRYEAPKTGIYALQPIFISQRPLPDLPKKDQSKMAIIPIKDPKGDRDSGIEAPGKLKNITSSQESLENNPKNMAEIAPNFDDQDYHEYCDIDYEEPRDFSAIKDVVFRSGQKIQKTVTLAPPLPPRIEENSQLENFYDVSTSKLEISVKNQKKPPEKLSKVSHPTLPPRNPENQLVNVLYNGKNQIYDRPQKVTNFQSQLAILINKSRIDLDLEIKKFDLLESLKPLNQSLFDQIETFLLNTSSSDLALAICQEDARFLNSGFQEIKCGLNFTTFFLLPIATKLRKDILERGECFGRFLIASLLKCDNVGKRVEILAKWIKTAQILLENHGNLYAFAYLMTGLESEPLAHLSSTWSQLRVDFTELALHFETKMKMQRNNPKMDLQNSTFLPDLIPIVKLIDCNNVEALANLNIWNDDSDTVTFGLDSFFENLSTCRNWLQRNQNFQCATISKKSADLGHRFVTTEFQTLFLWGSKGCRVDLNSRLGKLDMLFKLMATQNDLN